MKDDEQRRDSGFPSKQSPVSKGDCSPALQQTQCGASVAKCARNDMQTASLREFSVR